MAVKAAIIQFSFAQRRSSTHAPRGTARNSTISAFSVTSATIIYATKAHQRANPAPIVLVYLVLVNSGHESTF